MNKAPDVIDNDFSKEVDYQQVHSYVAMAGEIIAPSWPIRTFIARNPLMGLENLPFSQAVHLGHTMLGRQGYLSEEHFREFYRAGRITDEDLDWAFHRMKLRPAETFPFGSPLRPVESRQLMRQVLVNSPNNFSCPGAHGKGDISGKARTHTILGSTGGKGDPGRGKNLVDPGLWTAVLEKMASLSSPHGESVPTRASGDEKKAPSIAQRSLKITANELDRAFTKILEDDLDRVGRFITLGEWCDVLAGRRIIMQINEQMIKWCAAFLDEGQAAWTMPDREEGFYHAWRQLAVRDLSGRFLGIRRFSQKIRQLSEHPEEALVQSLTKLGIPEKQWPEYLARHLGQLPGWAGFIKWRALNPHYDGQMKYPINLVEYLAVRVFYESVLVAEACDRTWHIGGNLQEMQGYFRKHVAEYYARQENGQLRMWPIPVDRSSGNGNPGDNRTARSHGRTLDEHQWKALAKRLYLRRTVDESCRKTAELFYLFQGLGWSQADVQALSENDVKQLVSWLEILTPKTRSQIWLEAFERHYRRELVKRLSAKRTLSVLAPTKMRTRQETDKIEPDQGFSPEIDSGAVDAQVVFCIDVRSEGFRRHLESMGNYETMGFAGFYGVPVRFRPFETAEEVHLHPPILDSKNLIVEVARDDQDHVVHQHVTVSRWEEFLHRLIHGLKHNLVAPFAFVESVGWLWSLKLVGKTVLPGAWRHVHHRVRTWLKPPVKTSLCLDKSSLHAAKTVSGWAGCTQTVGRATGQSMHVAGRQGYPPEREEIITGGFTPEEQAEFVASALKTMGLTKDFGRVVLLLGHGSQSENNPHASSLDCGAAGGHHGGPSARILAAMANRPIVRRLLSQYGLRIPDGTLFLAGEHNTTTDQVVIYDQWRIPSSHREDVHRLLHDLGEAGTHNARERLMGLPGAPRHPDRETVLQHVHRRSADWAQTRPEWGLAGNAAFIAGRRSLTRGLNLENRVFLHSYDYEQDPDGKSLEAIMTGPLVVAHWISMEYYFSSIDNPGYGSGSKVTQNVVGLVGVMQGRRSDLQTGLSLQSVMDGKTFRHEPMRLLAVIEAPVARLSAVIRRNAGLKRLLTNEWVHLMALDPEKGEFLCYRSDGHWEPLEPDGVGRPGEEAVSV